MLEWQDRAACNGVDVEIFFDDVGNIHGPLSTAARHARWRAKQYCATCPVAQQCLDFALNTKATFGVYGGFDSHERAGLFGGDQKFKDGHRRAVLERLRHEGLTENEIATRARMSPEYVRLIFQRRMVKTSQPSVNLREYLAWPMAWQGFAPREIAGEYEIPYERALDMCKLVDRQDTYTGPRGYDRNVYRTQAV